ncbi:hypothetical protein PENFLA_c007G11034 [Penicillium flavigenum]|uniref:Uncharacterized protein n=1 Tax=Penicillium flavigenum TaxID=254877 RepID=A0A1V6TJD5_9EURO|nr:hypothetical protein PENFLA_c007G11034 [Penicillium flavigenum]
MDSSQDSEQTVNRVLQRHEELGLPMSCGVAKTAISGYAKRNKICHGALARLNDKDTRNTIASYVDDLGRSLLNYKAESQLLGTNCQSVEGVREVLRGYATVSSGGIANPGSISFTRRSPRTAEQKEFTQALEEGLFQGELDQLSRDEKYRSCMGITLCMNQTQGAQSTSPCC